MMNELIGFFYVLLAGFGFGFLGIFARLGFRSGLTVGEILTWRFSLAAIILWIALLFFKRKLIRLTRKQIFISAALGAFGYALFSSLYFLAIQGISVSLAAMLLFTFPIFVNLGAHFFLKEHLKLRQFISLILALIGIGILVWGPIIINSTQAIIYAILASVSYSVYVLVSGYFQKGVEPLSSSLYVISATALMLFIFHQPSLNRLQNFSAEQLWIVFGLATVCTIAPLTLFLAGLQKLSSTKASIVVMIEPVVAALAAWVFLNERLSLSQIGGAIVILVALILNSKKSSDNDRQ